MDPPLEVWGYVQGLAYEMRHAFTHVPTGWEPLDVYEHWNQFYPWFAEQLSDALKAEQQETAFVIPRAIRYYMW